MRSSREGRRSSREVGRTLTGLLKEEEPVKRTNKDRQASVVSWNLMVEHFRRRVCP